jgi:hypothetical protein
MKELKQMGWMVLGVVGGFLLGLWVFLEIFQVTGSSPAANPTLSLILAVPILGGGLVGGGALAQWLVHRRERVLRRKRQKEKDAAKPRKKKKS